MAQLLRAGVIVLLTVLTVLALAGMFRATLSAQSAPAPAERTDYLTFAQGAVPVSVGGTGAQLGASFEKAIRAVDGDPGGYVLTLKPGTEAMDLEFVYELPAATTFDRFAVPNIRRNAEPDRDVHAAWSKCMGPRRARPTATSCSRRPLCKRIAPEDMVTELAGRREDVLSAGSSCDSSAASTSCAQPRRSSSARSSATARQETGGVVAIGSDGVWKGRGVLVQLRQDGAVVSGCYDQDGDLTGTVTGNVLKALGVDRSDRVPSAFILSVREDGTLLGVRSSNRAPFVVYAGDRAPEGSAPSCPPPPAVLGCGAVIHGINFDFDSATIRHDSDPVLSKLFEGLRGDSSGAVVIEGHTSNEGPDQVQPGLVAASSCGRRHRAGQARHSCRPSLGGRGGRETADCHQ